MKAVRVDNRLTPIAHCPPLVVGGNSFSGYFTCRVFFNSFQRVLIALVSCHVALLDPASSVAVRPPLQVGFLQEMKVRTNLTLMKITREIQEKYLGN
jgi:hypothetical protein